MIDLKTDYELYYHGSTIHCDKRVTKEHNGFKYITGCYQRLIADDENKLLECPIHGIDYVNQKEI